MALLPTCAGLIRQDGKMQIITKEENGGDEPPPYAHMAEAVIRSFIQSVGAPRDIDDQTQRVKSFFQMMAALEPEELMEYRAMYDYALMLLIQTLINTFDADPRSLMQMIQPYGFSHISVPKQSSSDAIFKRFEQPQAVLAEVPNK